jgi:VWFA-related protein
LRRLFSLIPLLLATLPLLAQQPASPLPAGNEEPLRVATRIVVLDVVVTDKKGNVVNDLKPEDFTIVEDTVPQTIRSFEPPSAHFIPEQTKVAEVKSMDDVQKKMPNAPITILVLDELNTKFEDMSYARYTLQKYLKSQPAKLAQPTSMTVATNTHFIQIHDYTLDRDALLKALAAHQVEYPFKASRGGGSFAAENLAATLSMLQQIARATSGHPGRKNMIWVGKGFPPVDLTNQLDSTAATLTNAVQQTVNQLRDARITLTTIDPTATNSYVESIVTPDDLDVELDAMGDDPFSGDINFTNLAPETGGRAVYGRNDVGVQIGDAIHEGGNYYTLSYTPSSASDEQSQYRHIAIKLSRPDLTATTRNGYYTGVDTRETQPMQNLKLLAMDLGAAATSTVVYTGLGIKAERGADTNYKISVDSKTLNWVDQPNGDRTSEVTIIMAAFNKQNKIIAHVGQEMTAHIAADKIAEAIDKRVSFTVPFQFPANTTRLRVIVRDASNGKIGTADLDPVTGKQQ